MTRNNEKDFYTANRDLCSLEKAEDKKTPEDTMKAIYEQLLKEGGKKDGEQ